MNDIQGREAARGPAQAPVWKYGFHDTDGNETGIRGEVAAVGERLPNAEMGARLFIAVRTSWWRSLATSRRRPCPEAGLPTPGRRRPRTRRPGSEPSNH